MLFADRCPACRQGWRGLCPRCRAGLRPAPPGPVAAAFAYEGVGRSLVVGLKRRPRRAALAVLATALAALVPAPLVDVVTWAPTSAVRRRGRGYDQAELLARAVGRELGVPCRPLLRRTDRAGPQEGRTRAERLAGPAFSSIAPAPGLLAGACVLVVDDVVTTGGTLRAAARALESAGAGRVLLAAATAADALRPDSGRTLLPTLQLHPGT